QARDLAQLRDELAGPVGLQQRGGVVEQEPRGSELGQAAGRVDDRLVPAASVEEAGLELAPRLDDRLRRLAEVLDVVERVVQPEDVHAARRGARDEAPREVVAHRAGADEEPAAQGERKRRRGSRLQRTQPLPWALDAAADGAVEDAAAGDLEVCEARSVENLGQTEELRGGHEPCERLLAQ